MSTNNAGGPAFPIFPETGGGHAAAFRGMTLRDYFAAKAMKALIESDPKAPAEAIAFVAYRTADAMLKERDA